MAYDRPGAIARPIAPGDGPGLKTWTLCDIAHNAPRDAALAVQRKGLSGDL